ncbi:Actin-related protein 2/3 complex subunit 1 [Hondaea fermentalgiana]|uniref:Actin-related protein 2/3 complex subunit n=1 Tax=Hondaea fermentalgiana TaxID=2315210 RepID=A0A2R5G676_9STRA|nr:Actin-related protein 2/3 complex subunit 1 [Hondaea fermentalgiana]|eukprot:GBG26557.1 Actin-related protein 2/3 complex subunit 1 [Hondaea fermentalgiana]
MGLLKVNTTGITCHAWSPDRKRIAVCENSEKVFIYKDADKPDPAQWVKEHELVGHDLVVTAIDWSPVHNKIVTCSHDRNAFVWTLGNGEWKPSLSILRINRAALDVKWSPDGKKFAVASGAKVVPVCHYETHNDWWISKMIKKHKSTVTSVAWHPNSQLLATGSTDFRCRIFSAFISDFDQGVDSVLGDTSKHAFGDLLTEFDASNGWVSDVAFSPSGDRLAFVGHDSSVSFVTFDGSGSPMCQTLKSSHLPNSVVMFLSDEVVVAAGHEFNPEVYQLGRGNAFECLGFVDQKGSGGASSVKKAASNFSAARNIWANKTTRGTEVNDGAQDLWTRHHNAITDIQPYSDTQHSIKIDSFSTSGLDGRINIWTSSDLGKVSKLSL